MVSPFSGSATSNVAATGNARIDALIGGVKWGGAAGSAATISFSFPQAGSTWSTNAGSGYGPASGDGEPWAAKYAGLTTAQQAAFRGALAAWSDVANITFVEVADTAGNVGDIRVAWTGRSPMPTPPGPTTRSPDRSAATSGSTPTPHPPASPPAATRSSPSFTSSATPSG